VALLGMAACNAILGLDERQPFPTTSESGGAGGSGGGSGGGGEGGGDAGNPCGDATPAIESCADPADEDCDGYDCVMWAELYGDNTDQHVLDIALDSIGNSYVVGAFTGAIPFDDSTLIAVGSGDVFLAKFDAGGNHVWSKQFGDAGPETGFAVAVDSAGNVILGGFSKNAISFGGPTMASGAFVAKLTSEGEHVWSKGFGGVVCGDFRSSTVESIAITPQDDVVIAGSFCGSIDFGDGAIASQTPTYEDAFLAKLRASDGSAKVSDGFWGKVFGDWVSQYARHVAVDGVGNILLAGDFAGTLDLGLGPMVSSPGYVHIYLAKFTGTGAAVWNKPFGDDSSQYVWDLAVDNLGGPIVTGYFDGTVDFGGGNVTANGYDGFIFKYSTGKEYQWSKTFGDVADQSGRVVAVDSDDNVLLAGKFDGSIDLGAGSLTSAGMGDVFLAKLTSAGVVLWNKRFGDATNQDPKGLSVTASGESILTGWAQGTIDFGTGSLTSAGEDDMFLAKFAP
jgi:hypothetical protein